MINNKLREDHYLRGGGGGGGGGVLCSHYPSPNVIHKHLQIQIFST